MNYKSKQEDFERRIESLVEDGMYPVSLAHLILDLYAAYKELVKQQEWISVKEILPKMSGWHLVYLKAYDDVNIRRFDLEKWNCIEGEKITHWKPLPQPPEDNT